MKKLIVYCDGASRGNPGEAGIGCVIENERGEVIKKISDYLGTATNNIAEYNALVRSLQECLNLKGGSVEVYMDSELIVKQINGEYKVKNKGLMPLYQQAVGIIKKFNNFSIKHIPREKNKEADKLANEGIDSMLTNS